MKTIKVFITHLTINGETEMIFPGKDLLKEALGESLDNVMGEIK